MRFWGLRRIAGVLLAPVWIGALMLAVAFLGLAYGILLLVGEIE